MKKTNNKFRNNNNSNQIYSLNYKFDSISVAGKISGTALDLIKKYNELAKEAHGNNDYVTAEIFRQYAEHYRKIVTEINEKKNAQKIVSFQKSNETQPVQDDNVVSNDNLDEDSKNAIIAKKAVILLLKNCPILRTMPRSKRSVPRFPKKRNLR